MTNACAPPAPSDAERPAAYADRVGAWYASQRPSEHKKRFGQYLTPLAVARYMAGLYRPTERATLRILDPGAGSGTLTCAVCEALASCDTQGLRAIHVVAYETDAQLAGCLNICLRYAGDWLNSRGIVLTSDIRTDDFVLANAEALETTARLIPSEGNAQGRFDLVIANPPYFKIPKSDARARAAATVVHGQPNIYALFMAISALLLEPHGELICITPRSYAAGPYFRLFRERFFATVRPEAVHLFESRQDAFGRDAILQENVILLARREDGWYAQVNGETVAVSASTGMRDLYQRDARAIPVRDVIDFASKDKVLRIPASRDHDRVVDVVHSWGGSLHAYGMNISTGPVVAFRATALLSHEGTLPESHAPLLWMQNVRPMRVTWPTASRAKAQYMTLNRAAMPLLLKNQNYVILRRFSAKEEERRLITAPYLSRTLSTRYLGLENHLNYIHRPGGSLSDEVTYGLAALFNSALLDTYFRVSNGNTQVSATEIRAMPLPPLAVIEMIGKRVLGATGVDGGPETLRVIDDIVRETIAAHDASDIVEAVRGER